MRALGEQLVAKVPPRYQQTARQFIKFVVTGTVGATVDFGIYNILTRGFEWDTVIHVWAYPIIAANLVSVFLAITSNFLLNKYWTFRNTDRAVMKQWSSYIILNIITFTINQILTSFFTFRVPLIALLFGNQKDNAAKALAIGCILFINFIGSKFLIFRKKQPAATPTPVPTWPRK